MLYCQCSSQNKVSWYLINKTTFDDFSENALRTEIQWAFNHKPKVIQAYLEHSRSSPKYTEPLENLDTILDNLSKPNCLLLINNFIGLNLRSSLPVPIVLRQISYAFLYVKHSKRKRYLLKDLIWFPRKMKSFISNNSVEDQNWKILKEIEHPCPVSKYFTGTTPYNYANSGHCVGLNLDKYVVAAKPWQCQVDINLFMPFYMIALGKHTQVFTRSESWFDIKIKRIIPSGLSPISILVNHKPISFYDKKVLLKWMTGDGSKYFRDHFLYHIINNALIIGSVYCFQNELKVNLCKIFDLQLLAPCFDCKYGFLTKTVTGKNARNVLMGVAKQSQRTIWRCNNDDKKFIHETNQMIINSNRNGIFNRRLNTFKSTDESHKRLQIAYASLIHVLLGNASVLLFEDKKYPLRLLWVINHYREMNAHVLRVPDKLTSLHFISCGAKGIEGLLFSEFFAVFHKHIWLGLIITVLVTLICLKIVSKRANLINTLGKLLYFVKIFLEQGDPFPPSLLNDKSFRYVITGALLAGVVISNAYKSTNVYNIVTPRKTIPYTHFEELKQDNFSVYSRIVEISYTLDTTDYYTIKT